MKYRQNPSFHGANTLVGGWGGGMLKKGSKIHISKIRKFKKLLKNTRKGDSI